jgi:hypothetical protein
VICLYCEATLPNALPQTCPCEIEHLERPPIAGINHVSQLLCALDDLRAGELELGDLDGLVDVFLGYFESFEQKWRPEGTSLEGRLAPALKEAFAASLQGIDNALDLGSRALEILQTLEEPLDEQRLEEAEQALIGFFQSACGHAAAALDAFDSLKARSQRPGGFLNLGAR